MKCFRDMRTFETYTELNFYLTLHFIYQRKGSRDRIKILLYDTNYQHYTKRFSISISLVTFLKCLLIYLYPFIDNESVMVHYKRYLSRCDRYQCSQVKQTMGHILYRQSCNTGKIYGDGEKSYVESLGMKLELFWYFSMGYKFFWG